jgi:hypothetical protein
VFRDRVSAIEGESEKKIVSLGLNFIPKLKPNFSHSLWPVLWTSRLPKPLNKLETKLRH